MTVTNHAPVRELNHNPISPERSREGSSRTKQDAEHVRGFVRDPQRASTSYGISTVFVINTIVLLIAGLLVIYYVVQANIIAASNYKISMLNQKLESLNEVRSSLAAQKSSMEDPAKILDFALSQNMVEAKNAVYLFENPDVAYEKP